MSTPSFTVQVVNSSTLPVYITAFGFGLDPATGQTVADQSFIEFDASGIGTLVTPTGWMPTPASPIGIGDTLTLNLPSCSGRVYVSINTPLCLSIDTTGNTTISDPQFTNPQDPNYQVIYDKFEFFWNPDLPGSSPPTAQAVIDTTAVDYFGLPLTVSMGGQTMGIGQSLSSMQTILTSGNANSDPTQPGLAAADYSASWGLLPLYGSNGTLLRVLSPINAAQFPADYLQAYIGDIWSYYGPSNDNTLTINVGSGVDPNPVYTGSVNESGDFVFTNPAAPTPTSVTLPQPESAWIWACSSGTGGPPWDPSNGTPDAVIVSVLTAAMNLGILPLPDASTVLTSDFASDGSLPTYYANTVDSTPGYNLYAALLHSLGDQVYAFPYDDVAGQSSQLASSDSNSTATVTINSLSGIVPPPLTSTDPCSVTMVAGKGGSGSVMYDGTTLDFSNPPSEGSPESIVLAAAPAVFSVSYDTGGGSQSYTINMVTQSACPFTGVTFSPIDGGTQISWPGAPQ